MPGYVEKILMFFQYEPPKRRQDVTYLWNHSKYGEKTQYSRKEDDPPPLSEKEKKNIQKFTETFLFYITAVYPTMLTTLSEISLQQ